MCNNVIKIPAEGREILHVAAYCRVSTAYEEQQSSLDAQVYSIIQITLPIMPVGLLRESMPSRHPAPDLITGQNLNA